MKIESFVFHGYHQTAPLSPAVCTALWEMLDEACQNSWLVGQEVICRPVGGKPETSWYNCSVFGPNAGDGSNKTAFKASAEFLVSWEERMLTYNYIQL